MSTKCKFVLSLAASRWSVGLLLAVVASPTLAGVKAFPTAEGFGAETPGGRGGRVIHVTSLADSGPGTLRQALEVETGKRIVVFDVGGNIYLNKKILIRSANSYVTVAGQTAPGGGIQIINHGITVLGGAHDVVLRHLRIRPGLGQAPNPPVSPWVQNALVMYGNDGTHVHHVVVDHCSVMWAADEMVSIWSNATDITMQWSIVAEGLTAANYPGAMSKGVLIGSYVNTVTLHHNLLAHNADRSPTAGGHTLDVRNNLVYNWSTNNAAKFGNTCGSYDSKDRTPLVNFVGNQYIPGPDSSGTSGIWLGGNGTKMYSSANYGPLCPNGCSNDWDNQYREVIRTNCTSCPCSASGYTIQLASASTYRSSTPFSVPAVKTTPTGQLKDLIFAKVGPTPWKRDREDKRIVDSVRNKTGKLGMNGTHPSLASGTAPLDTDRDGMPDTWEKSHGLNPNNAADAAGLDSNGYTNVENYINELAGDFDSGQVVIAPAPEKPMTFVVQ